MSRDDPIKHRLDLDFAGQIRIKAEASESH